ncbi:hypothetical protein AVEN_101266-1, partial [Araneus ventricosus]
MSFLRTVEYNLLRRVQRARESLDERSQPEMPPTGLGEPEQSASNKWLIG